MPTDRHHCSIDFSRSIIEYAVMLLRTRIPGFEDDPIRFNNTLTAGEAGGPHRCTCNNGSIIRLVLLISNNDFQYQCGSALQQTASMLKHKASRETHGVPPGRLCHQSLMKDTSPPYSGPNGIGKHEVAQINGSHCLAFPQYLLLCSLSSKKTMRLSDNDIAWPMA